MAVGNLVVGDSRVEKAAITARDLGYKVTVVGIRRRTVQQVSFIDGDVPVIRPPVGNEHHLRVADSITRREAFLEKRRRQINRLPQRLKRPAYIAHRIGVRSRDAGVKASAKFGRSWRTLWPHLVDYEATFFDAFRALEPDLIHVHDRHPLPGAAKYSSWAERTPGVRPVKWLYDAHEFVPTQHLPPPVEHQQAWIAVERECIQQADAVVTVTDKIADLIQQRHRLDTTPAVVRNLPSLKQAEQNDLRSDVRSELGLAPGVPIAVYAGGITPQRGLGTLLDAQPMVPGLHVAIICKNGAERRNALRDQAKKLGTADRLHFLDYVPASHVSRFISTANLGISALLPSPAHEEAAPTKVSEYLHAHLPVVVSDMRAQAERVRRLGFGAVYPSGDAHAMAQVIQHVLSRASEFKAQITEEVILDNSWEADASNLESAWNTLRPSDRVAQPHTTYDSYLPILQVDDGLNEAWGPALNLLPEIEVRSELACLRGIRGDLTDGRFMLTEDGQRFLEFWRLEAAQLLGVLYEDSVSLVEGWNPALTTGILSMSGKPAIRMLPGRSLYDVDNLKSRYPHHWLNEVSESEANRYRREFLDFREKSRAQDRRIVTDCLVTNWSLGNQSSYIASPVELGGSPEGNSGPIRIGWIENIQRSVDERASIEQLQAELSTSATVVRIPRSEKDMLAQRLDIFIDSLSTEMPTRHGLLALGAGSAVVVGRGMAVRDGSELEINSTLPVETPLIHTTPNEIHARISKLVYVPDELNVWKSHSYQFAREFLSATAVATRLAALILK
ncbi:glycosyltransferase family 4 protein [Brevibacterium sp. ZH18]|uniref:glycosyltransferase family 4 protein n=1 Tax=Brevibacterium sp. ZH18 TaxID=2927784 RepID=UPI001F60DE4B|nr:glycosyltransferase family 4 protein [Brevibacterium sp. ZH18]MCI4011735.1 glycosyltransferase family 4 protein [Brevibacterium sp. ZH18]